MVNRQEEPKEPLERQMQAPKRHPQLKPETWRPCWKMDQVLKGRGKDDTEVEHSEVLKVGPTNQEAHRIECNRRRCQPKAQRKGSTPAYRHHLCQESRSPAVESGPEDYKVASQGQGREEHFAQEPAEPRPRTGREELFPIRTFKWEVDL